MSSSGPSKTSGKTDEVVGSVKSSVGGMMGNKDMQHKGDAQHSEGQAQTQAAAAKQKAESHADGGKGNMEKLQGAITGDDKKKAQGDAHKAEGAMKGNTA